MQLQEIQLFTKNPCNYGKNSTQILTKFMAYAEKSLDPQNIFKYMQQKVICTFLPSFWLCKSDLLATMGDYSSCLQCLEMAVSIRGICDQQSEKTINLELKYADLLNKIQSEMKKYHVNSKRSAQEFNLLTYSNQVEVGLKDVPALKTLIKIYDKNYQGLKKIKQTQTIQKRQQFGRSWLYHIYQHQAFEQNKIIQKIRSNSMEGDGFDYHSLYTPPKKANQHKLTKTVDSVQIQKRKKQLEKSRKNQNQNVNKEQDQQHYRYQDLEQNEMNSIANSMPVGKHFFELKRRVTFGENHFEEVYKHKEKIYKDVSPLSFQKKQQKSRSPSIKLPNKTCSNPA